MMEEEIEKMLSFHPLDDKGSPVYRNVLRGKVLLGFLFKSMYRCEWVRTPELAPLNKDFRSIYATLSAAMPWIVKTLVEETSCPCIGRSLHEWRDFLEEPLPQSLVMKPEDRLTHPPDHEPDYEDY